MSVERFGERIPGGAVCAEKLVIPEFFRRMRYTTAGGGRLPAFYHITSTTVMRASQLPRPTTPAILLAGFLLSCRVFMAHLAVEALILKNSQAPFFSLNTLGN